MPSEPADAEADGEPYWADAVLGDTELDIHTVAPETFAEVHPQPDGTVVFDEGWGDAWVETDTVAEVRR